LSHVNPKHTSQTFSSKVYFNFLPRNRIGLPSCDSCNVWLPSRKFGQASCGPFTEVRLFFRVKGGASTVIPKAVQRACLSSTDREHPQPSGDAVSSGGEILLKFLVV